MDGTWSWTDLLLLLGDTSPVRARDAVEAVRLVREEGADPNALDNDEWSAVHYAAEFGDTSLVRALCSAEGGGGAGCRGKGGCTPLFLAACEGHLLTVRCLVELGADVDKANDQNMTPLWTAAGGGHLAVVQFLVSSGATVGAVDDTGATPLHVWRRL